ncbi:MULTISPECIES: hypothetical protein [Winogradskyella]|jgi:hypothetical protein|uniref:hypothetical protein n=1 Tax=Winogradskyella TaxID=286104 RepID=UPI0015C9FA51|nr:MULTISPECIES: hypothetical protein [Winogradskyella]QXP78667.1 hypothetical protein H0I32_15905 [Winogradskyella sp. HaHa_3_26]
MTYKYNKTCKCGNVDSIEVDKREAAFELKDSYVHNFACSKCGGKNFSSISSNKPDIDEELLSEWSKNPEYYFSSQDEDLLLAQHNENIDLYLKFIDQNEIDTGKRNVLIEALCVMIYDKANKSDQKSLDIISAIATELKKRSDLVQQSESWIMDYIKKVSFPIIGIEYKESLSSKADEKFLESNIEKSIPKNNLWNEFKKIWK